MIYSKILSPKFRNLIRVFVIILVSVFSLSLFSCQTTYTDKYNPENFRDSTYNDYNVKILDITTKSDSVINLSDYEAKYYPEFNDAEDVIVYKKTDTIFIKKEPVKEYKLKENVSKINLNDIMSANVEKTKTNVQMTVLLAFGIVVLTGLAFFAAGMSDWNSHWNGR
jgi:hypothetical protein